MTPSAVQDFSIHVSDEVLEDLHDRLVRTRWPDAVADDWERGTAPGAMTRLVEHWRDEFDWRAVESRLNAHEQVTVDVEGGRVHVLRAGTRGGTPLLLLHGWPDSFLRFEKALPLLERFDLVVPSIPGYGFSDRPTTPGVDGAAIAARMAAVMSALGYERYAVHGGDIGSAIGENLALQQPERVLGLHLTDVPLWRARTLDPTGLSPAETAYLDEVREWTRTEGAYMSLQSTKPQTLAYALNDTPAGLAAWFLEKFRAWSDCDGDVWTRFTPDEMATNATIYWVTQTAGSAARLYLDNARLRRDPASRVRVPMAFALFPHDIAPAPRELAARFYDIVRWTEMSRGGHFGAWEEPQPFADDLGTFVDGLEG